MEMRMEIRSDSVVIDGYVNAVERDSREILTERGRCVEQIRAGAFGRALEKSENVTVLLNHRKNRELASQKSGTAELMEDNIGLRAIVTISDAEVIEKAKKGQLRGWSFGMVVTKDTMEQRGEGKTPRRIVEELNLQEVSIIDSNMLPCYIGTSIEQRAEGDIIRETRGMDFAGVKVYKEQEPSEAEKQLKEYQERLKNLTQEA